MDIVSKSAFAGMIGVAPSAVSNHIARGKLTGAALTADGRIVVEEALRQLSKNIDPGLGRPPKATAPDDPLAALRLRRETLAVEKQERDAAVERGELVPAAEAARRWAHELEDLLAAVEMFIVELPPRLGLTGRDAIEQARREWRSFRERRAAQSDPAHAA